VFDAIIQACMTFRGMLLAGALARSVSLEDTLHLGDLSVLRSDDLPAQAAKALDTHEIPSRKKSGKL